MPPKKQKTKIDLKPLNENKYFVRGLFSLFIVLVIVLTTYKVEDDDIYWHLATGRFIVENKYVPDKDVFGLTTQNSEWIPFEWGWDVISYGLYNIGGYPALFIFRSLIICLIFYLLFRLLNKFKVNSVISIVLLFLLVFAMLDRLSPRPHLFSYLFLTLILYLFLTFKYFDRDKYFKRLYFLPLIFLLWGNIHMGVIAGGLLLFIFVLSEVLIYYIPKRFSTSEIKPITKEHLKKLVFISILSAFVLLINPHGLHTYQYAFGHTKMKMLESITEWQNPFNGMIDKNFIVILYYVFLFGGVIILFYSYKKKDITFALIYIVFSIYSVRAVRFAVDYEIIMMFFIAESINYFLKSSFKPGLKTSKIFFGNPVKIIIAIFFVFILYTAQSNSLYISLKYLRMSGWGMNEYYEPVGLYKFMSDNNISGVPLNNYESGGYLIWNFPGQKNFIDSRNLNDDIFNEYMSILFMNPGFDKKLEQYGFDFVIYYEPHLAKFPDDMKRKITLYLSTQNNWKLVYWDDMSMLFVKDVPKFYDLINKYEYKIFKPYSAVFARKEFEAKIKENPDLASKEIKRKEQSEPNGYFFGGMYDIANKVLKNVH